MDTNNVEKIINVVNYIENNLKNDISQNSISDYCGMSKYYLHRIFKSLTNKTIMEYVRGRKLANSIHQLLNTDYKIIDIAIENGFSHEQSFIRCFKNHYNITPAKYRRKKIDIVVETKIDTNLIYPLNDKIIIVPKYYFKHSFCLLGIEYTIDEEDDMKNLIANKYGTSFYKTYGNSLLGIDNTTYFAFIKDIPPNRNIYTPSFQVLPDINIPTNMVLNNIPTHTYAVFKYIGFHSPEDISIRELDEIYTYIYHYWQLHSEFKCGDFHIERVNSSICSNDYCEMELLFPISQ